MSAPLLIDLFCGGGGASAGYVAAGFRVIGVDIDPHPEYPYEMIQGDVFEVAPDLICDSGAVFVHASPPCQASSPTNAFRNSKNRVNPTTTEPTSRIDDTRSLLRNCGVPHVIENVAYKATGLRCDLMLCGDMFGLNVFRHRWFEFSDFMPHIVEPIHRPHTRLATRNGTMPTEKRPVMTITGRNGHQGKKWVRLAAETMGVPWLAEHLNPMCEAIPPAYTEYIGNGIMKGLNHDHDR